MLTLQLCLERADYLAQGVVNAWGVNVSGGNGRLLSADFRQLFDKTCLYREAKQTADNRREFNVLSEAEAANERTTREDFCRAYLDFEQKNLQAQ